MEEKGLHVRIVPMTADHLDEVAELERICFTTPWSRNMLAEELDNYLSAFLVALDDNGKVAGYAGLQAVARPCSGQGGRGKGAADGTAGSRGWPASFCGCFWTLPRPTTWRF